VRYVSLNGWEGAWKERAVVLETELYAWLGASPGLKLSPQRD